MRAKLERGKGRERRRCSDECGSGDGQEGTWYRDPEGTRGKQVCRNGRNTGRKLEEGGRSNRGRGAPHPRLAQEGT